MLDVIYLVIAVAFFGLGALYVRGCARLMEPSADE
jgi:hypothetical protein